MKKVISLLIASVFLLCGCVQAEQTEHPDLEKFSYSKEYAEYNDGSPGVRTSGFVNTESTEINNADQVVELAKKECRGTYNTIRVAFDPEQNIYRVHFSMNEESAPFVTLGEDLSVYINEKGITQLIVAGE